MGMTRRTAALLLVGTGTGLLATRLFAQDQAPNRPEFTIVAKDFHYSPERIEVAQDDLVKLTVRSEDVAHTFTSDEYRIVRRVAAGGSTVFDFRADRPGTFTYYCSLTSEPG